MPSIVKFYGIMPRDFWELPIDEIQVLIAFRDAVQKAQEKAQRRAAGGRGRRY